MEQQEIESALIQIKYPQTEIPILQFKCPLKWTTQRIIQFALKQKPTFKMPQNKEPGLFYSGQELDFGVTLKDILRNNEKTDSIPVFLIIVSKDQQQAQRIREDKLQTISVIYKMLYENLSEEKCPSQITNFSHALPYYPLMNIEMSQEALLMKEFWSKVKTSDLKLFVTEDGNLVIGPELNKLQAQQQQPQNNENNNDNTTYFILKLIFQLVVFYMIFKPYFQGYYQYIFIAVMVIYFKISLNDRRLQQRQQAERDQRAEIQRAEQMRQQQEQNANNQQQQTQNVEVNENLQQQPEEQDKEQVQEEEKNTQEDTKQEELNEQNLKNEKIKFIKLANQQPPKRSIRYIFGAIYEFFYCLFISLFPSWYVELYIQHHQENQQKDPEQEKQVPEQENQENTFQEDTNQLTEQKEGNLPAEIDQSFQMKQQNQFQQIEEGVIKDENFDLPNNQEEQKTFEEISKNEEIDE